MSNRLPIRIESPHPSRAIAIVGKRIVGIATAWFDSNGKWVILGSEVKLAYRRRGIATEMYKTIERNSGIQLEPAISLSDDAFNFWKSYRPQAVSTDLRHCPELLGRKVCKNGRIGTIVRASGGGVTIKYDDGDNTIGVQSWIHRDALHSHFL